MKYVVYQQTSDGVKVVKVRGGCATTELSVSKRLTEMLPDNFIYIGNTVFDIRTIIRVEVKNDGYITACRLDWGRGMCS